MNPNNIDLHVNEQLKKHIQSVVDNKIKIELGFIKSKKGDSPSDAISLVPRKYVTANGTTRPTSPVVGQFFLDMSLASGRGKPIWWNETGWVDATGTYV